jgi:predicted ribosome quality control (RQC) complex YloA/Tae2 family protein
MKELLTQLGGYSVLVVIIGYFLKKFIDRQEATAAETARREDKLTEAISELTKTIIRIEGKLELYKAHSETIRRDVDELKDNVVSVDMRLNAVEKRCIKHTAE